MSAEVLKVRGVPYRTFAEVEDAVRELSASMILVGDDDDARDDIARHIGDLLANLPDAHATELLTFINLPFASEAAPEMNSGDAADEKASAQTGDPAAATAPPVCPMCLGEGTLDVEPPQDPTAQRCDACEGYGRVFTGSRVPEHAVRACPVCMGRGFKSAEVHQAIQNGFAVASDAPEWPGAMWNAETLRWDKPDSDPPWTGARWNDLRGGWDQ